MRPIAVPSSRSLRDGRRFVLELDRRLAPLDRGILLAQWDLYTGRSSRGPEPLQLKRTGLLSDPRLLPWIRSARGARWPALLARRLELLERIVLDTQVEQDAEIVRLREELHRTIVRFRPRWDGRRVSRSVVSRALLRDPDPARRRRAYYAFQSLGRPLEEPFRRLVRLRNEKARAAGFRSFAELRLGFQGFRPERIVELARLAARGARSRALELRDHLPTQESGGGWHPWDLGYVRRRVARLPDRPFARGPMLARILRAVERWGFPTERMRFRVAFHDIPAGGITLAPDPPADVRIVVHPRGGWESYQVMFHEVGHAVQSASIRSPPHLLRWHENVPGFGGFHEGIGGLFEEIARDREWLVGHAGVPPSTVEPFARSRYDMDLLSTGGISSWMLPELELYRNPDGDPMAAARRFERRVFGYDDSPPRSFVDAFRVTDPLYTANYLLAALFHYQIARALRDDLGEPLWPNRRVGPWLTRNWFAPGSLIEWVPHVKEVTGRPFGVEAFCEWFRRA